MSGTHEATAHLTNTYLIPATGSSYKKHVPDFPGLDQYIGELIHAADWPEAGLDLGRKKVAVKSFRRNGIATSDDQLHELDVIVLATGYDAVTGSLFDMGLQDKSGTALREKWESGVRTHLGLMVADMPNMFIVYGPQTPIFFANGPPFIEAQVDIIADIITECRQQNISTIDSTDEAAEVWATKVRDTANATLYPTADSWYMGANIPGEPREMLLYLGGVDTYIEKCRAALGDWSGFVLCTPSIIK